MSDNVFHQHLDNCKKCREQPFNLCPIGYKKLQEAVAATRPVASFEDFIKNHTGPNR